MTSELRDLPAIDRIGYGCLEDRTIATCWFSNGAKLRYCEREDGTVREELVHPQDPRTVWEAVDVTANDNRLLW